MSFFNYSDDTIKKHAFTTPWTFNHFLSGIWSYWLIKKFITNKFLYIFLIFFITHALYEAKDLFLYFGFTKKDKYWTNNSLANSLGDLCFAIIGFFLAANYKNISNISLIAILLFNLFTSLLFAYYKLG